MTTLKSPKTFLSMALAASVGIFALTAAAHADHHGKMKEGMMEEGKDKGDCDYKKWGKERHMQMMKETDANSDGQVSEEEFMAAHEKKFMEIDADSDGNVTSDEMKAHHKMMKEDDAEMKAEKHMKKMGMHDDDGMISKEEFMEQHKEKFKRMDKNEDGVLSEDDHDKE